MVNTGTVIVEQCGGRVWFKPIYFFVQSRVNRALNHSGERFQTNTVPVQPGFTGFVWAQGRFV